MPGKNVVEKAKSGLLGTCGTPRTKAHTYLDIHLLMVLTLKLAVLGLLSIEAFGVAEFIGGYEVILLYLSFLLSYWGGKLVVKLFKPEVTNARNRIGEWAGFVIVPIFVVFVYCHILGIAPEFDIHKWLLFIGGTGAIFTLTLVGNAFVDKHHQQWEQERKERGEEILRRTTQH